MTIELTYLIWSAVLVFAYVGAQSVVYRMDHGVQFANSARDNERPSGIYAARGEKAVRNLLETYAVFVALAVATELSGRSDGLTQWGVAIYFWARAAYLPAYLSGVPYIRSACWLVSMIGLGLLFVGVAF